MDSFTDLCRLWPLFGTPKTMGVEIEVLAVTVKGGNGRYRLLSDPTVSGATTCEIVRELLIKFFQEQTESDGPPKLGQTVNPYYDASPEPNNDHHFSYASWTVYTDSTVKASAVEKERAQEPGGFRCVFGEGNSSAWFRINDPVEAAKKCSWYVPVSRPVCALSDRTCGRTCPDMHQNTLFYNAHTKPSVAPQYLFEPIELISPILPATPEGLAAIATMYEFLHQHSFVVNARCGLHVHCALRSRVFDNDDSREDIPLHGLQRLLQVALCAEYQLSKMQPRHRFWGYYTRLNSSGALEAVNRTPRNAFDLVQSFPESFHQLVHWTVGQLPDHCKRRSEFFSMNFLRLSDPMYHERVRKKMKTVEFRAGAGTLSTSVAITWIDFVAQLFAKAVDEHEDVSWDFLADYNRNVTTGEFLHDVGLGEFGGRLQIWDHSWQDYIAARDRPWGHPVSHDNDGWMS